jgi:hypothetical protein
MHKCMYYQSRPQPTASLFSCNFGLDIGQDAVHHPPLRPRDNVISSVLRHDTELDTYLGYESAPESFPIRISLAE